MRPIAPYFPCYDVSYIPTDSNVLNCVGDALDSLSCPLLLFCLAGTLCGRRPHCVHVTSYLDVFPPHSPLTEAGSDYMSETVDLIFSAGTTNQTVMIMTSTDSIVEDMETFTLSLTSNDPAVMPQSVSTTVSITDMTSEYIHSHSMVLSMTNMKGLRL